MREERVRLERLVPRRAALDVGHLEARVHVVHTGLGGDGAPLRAAAGIADRLEVVLTGAGHAPPGFVAELADIAEKLPVVVTVRPQRGSILHRTYAFAGSERKVRALPVHCAAALSPAPARVKLMACLGAGRDAAGIVAAFASLRTTP